MIDLLRSCLCSSLAALALVPAQDAPSAPAPKPAEELYPPVRAATTLRFYSLSGDAVDAERLGAALRELGDGGGLAYGPVNTKSRPDDWFVAAAAPAGASDKEVLRAVKQGTGKAQELSFSAFLRESGDLDFVKELPRAAGSVRDLVVNMASEMRWFEATPEGLLFFYVHGLDAEECADRFDKLAGRKPRADLEDRLVRHSATWKLAPAAEKPGAPAKLEQGLERLPGVLAASLDAQSLQLHLALALADLRVSGPPWQPPAAEGSLQAAANALRPGAGMLPFMPRVHVDPLLDLIAEAGLAPVPPAPPAPPEGGGPGGG